VPLAAALPGETQLLDRPVDGDDSDENVLAL
jgi:hypothetical protein